MVGWKRRETVGALRANDIGFHRAGVSVGQVHDRVRQRIVAAVQHLAREQAGLVFLLRIAAKQLRRRRQHRCRVYMQKTDTDNIISNEAAMIQ